MKKKLCLLIAGLMLAGTLSAGCGNGETSAAVPEEVPSGAAEESAEEPAEEAAEETEGEESNLEVANDIFRIVMPEDTAGTFEAEASGNCITIFEKESKEAGFGGFVFSVLAYREPAEYAGGMDVKAGELTDGEGTLYDIVMEYPSEVQWDYEASEEMPESYARLYNGAEEIVQTLEGIDGGTFAWGAGTKGEDLYGEVLAKYVTAIRQNWDAERLEAEKMSSMYAVLAAGDEADPLEKAGYAYADANHDGIDELFIGEIAEGDWKGVVYDIYTIVDRAPAHVVSGWSRSRWYMLEDGFICNEYSGGAMESGWDVYDIEPNTTNLLTQVRMKYDGYENEEQPWFLSYGEDDAWENVSEEDFNERRETFSKYERFDFTPLSAVAENVPETVESEADYLGIAEDHEQVTAAEGCETFTQIVDEALKDGQGWANTDIGDVNALLVSESTFGGYDRDAAAAAEIFIYKDSAPLYLGCVVCGGSGTPLAISEDGFLMAAGHHYVGKYAIREDSLVTVEEAWSTYDTEGNETFHYNTGEDVVDTDAEQDFDRLFEEYWNAQVVGFDTVHR